MWTRLVQYNRLQPHINTVLMWLLATNWTTMFHVWLWLCSTVAGLKSTAKRSSTETTYQHCCCRFMSGHVTSCFRSVWYSQLGLSSVSHSKVTDHSYGQILQVVSGVGRRSWCRLVGWLVGGSVRSGQVSFCHDNSCLGDKKLQRYLQKSNSCHQKCVKKEVLF